MSLHDLNSAFVSSLQMLKFVVLAVVAVAVAHAQDKDKAGTRLGGGFGVPGAGGVFPGAGGVPGVGGVFPGAGGVFPGAGGIGPGPGGLIPGGGFNCNYCRTPVGYVCCKPGRCPPVRDVCPSTRFGPPVCRQDLDCSGSDKCCYDVCLEDTVCKPIVAGSQG